MSGADDRLELTWVGHSTVVLDLDGVRIITDPLLRRHNPPLRRRGPPPPPASWRDVTAVLLSHLHHDHADLPSLRRLGGTPVYTAAANARWLRRRGVNGIAVTEGEWVPLGHAGEIEITLVPAVHHSRPMPHRPNAANGHLMRSRWGTAWLAGDTSLYDGIADLPRVAESPIDLAVVPIGGWGARLSEGHMGPREAAEACTMVGARVAVAVHWGTLHPPLLSTVPEGWMDRPRPDFAAALAELAPRCALLDVVPGGSARLAPRSPGPAEH